MSANSPTLRGASALRQRIGASARALITDDVKRRASANLQNLSGLALQTLTARVAAMSAALSGPPEEMRTRLFQEAHDIRGVSGTFGLSALGEIADAICLYLDDLPGEQAPNTALLDNLVRVVQLTLAPHGASELVRASAECRAAVRLMRVREGRTPELS